MSNNDNENYKYNSNSGANYNSNPGDPEEEKEDDGTIPTMARSAAVSQNRSNQINEFQETKTVLLLAIMYTFAFFFTWIWIVTSITGIHMRTVFLTMIADYCKVIFLHCQGLFNAIIFIYNKVHMTRRSKPSLSFFQALKVVIGTPDAIPEMLLSSLELVNEDRRQFEDD